MFKVFLKYPVLCTLHTLRQCDKALNTAAYPGKVIHQMHSSRAKRLSLHMRILRPKPQKPELGSRALVLLQHQQDTSE